MVIVEVRLTSARELETKIHRARQSCWLTARELLEGRKHVPLTRGCRDRQGIFSGAQPVSCLYGLWR